MKTKCPECGTGKARRVCWRRNHAEICSACCASIRDDECGECVHYASTLQYEESRRLSAAGLSGDDFLMEVNPEVEEAVNAALKTAQGGGFRSAMETLTDLLRDHPLHHDVPFGIGVVHAMGGRHEDAILWFDRAIKIYPQSMEAHYNKAVAYEKLLDLSNCIRAFQKVIAIGPASEPEVAKARSIVKSFEDHIRKTEGVSLESYLRAAEKFNEAFKLMENGEWHAALKGFRASAELNDSAAPCHGNIGLCLAQLGKKAEGLAALERALEINPEYQPALTNREVFQKMIEGQPMENVHFESVNFSKENFLRKQS